MKLAAGKNADLKKYIFILTVPTMQRKYKERENNDKKKKLNGKMED